MYQVTDSDGISYPITLDRRPVEVFNPGWHALGLQTGLPPFHLLELHHDGPPELDAVWYLSDELDFVANTPQHFNQGQAAEVVSGISPLLRDIYDETLCAPQPDVAASSRAFDGINPIFVREMIGFVVDTSLSPPDVVMAQRLEGVSAHYTADGTRLSTSLLRHSLDVAIPQPGPDANANLLMLASPFDATLLAAQERFELGAGSISQVYRFRDPAGQMTLYLLFQQDGSPALYVPVMNTVFAARDGLSGAEVMTTLLSYYACHTGRVVRMHADEVVRMHADEALRMHADEASRMHADEVAEPADIAAAPAAAPREADEPVMPSLVDDPPSPPRDGSPAPAATDVAQHPGAQHPGWWKRLVGLGNP